MALVPAMSDECEQGFGSWIKRMDLEMAMPGEPTLALEIRIITFILCIKLILRSEFER